MLQKEKLLHTEREWERKMYEQKIKFLEDTIAAQEKKIRELKEELSAALTQVRELAEKVVEGVSGAKAFATVREIALEQARRPENAGEK